MSRADADAILQDLHRHAGLFDLSGDLGNDLADVAESDLTASFDATQTPDGDEWPELTSDYGRWKEANYPGKPIGVLTGELRAHLFAPAELTPGSVVLPIGGTDEAAKKAEWLEEGSDNRLARRWIGLTEEGLARSDLACERHLDAGV